MDFSQEDRVDSPIPCTQPRPIDHCSDDTPSRLLDELRTRRRINIGDHEPQESQRSSQTSSASCDEIPLLSVLNVVIDHEMLPPCPMEPEEFQEVSMQSGAGSLDVLVPVLRVFGPLIRGGNTDKPIQSACLYIHGAFPYLLARPVVAGPDGSLHHASHLPSQLSSSGYVDWDDVESVKRIVPELQSILETGLQAYERNMASKDDDNNETKNTKVKKSSRFIRRITVVCGRGFYTYCPGPPAPFLRIEYYNPKLKWMVKRTLEKGLEVPMSYHPDPQQYDAELTLPVYMKAQDPVLLPDDADVLKFHCYEAHIPYTMQFFKDYNLSGMAYIQISGGRFRAPIPQSIRRSNRSLASGSNFDERTFVASNVPAELLWENQPTATSSSIKESSVHSETMNTSRLDYNAFGENNSAHHDVGLHWLRKETSCDLEIDTSVQQILNVKSVMTMLPESPTERQQIHWRAVSSLKEIWRQERQRMSSLLQPKDDFLSNSKESRDASEATHTTPPFTLNVKKGASVPGTKLAVAGMSRLFQTVKGTEGDFRQAMKDIVEKHSQSVSVADARLRKRSITTSNPVAEVGKRSNGLNLTPTEDEAMDALGALEAQFDSSSPDAVGIPVSAGVAMQSSPNLSCFPNSPPLTQLSDSIDPVLREDMSLSMDDEIEMSQRLDRGDSIVELATQDGSLCHVEELINPHTLTPYDDPEDIEDDGFLDDENHLDEEAFKQTLSATATENDGSPKEGGPLSSDDGEEDYQVDTLDAQHLEANVSDDDGQSSFFDDSVASDPSHCGLLTQIMDWQSPVSASSADSVVSSPVDDVGTSSESIEDPLLSLNELLSSFKNAERHAILLETVRTPPSRGDVAESLRKPAEQIHPSSHLSGSVPAELEHVGNYGKIRSEARGGALDSTEWQLRNGYVETMTAPPTRKQVATWVRKKRKRAEKANVGLKRHKDGSAAPPQQRKAKGISDLRIDENSRMLTALPSSVCQERRQTAVSEVQEVEEVDWNAGDDIPSQDQSQQLSLSLSQNETGGTEERRPSLSLIPVSDCTLSAKRKSRDDDMIGRSILGNIESSLTVSQSENKEPNQALDGIGQIGGRIFVEGGGGLKATTHCLNDKTNGDGPPTRLLACSAARKLSSSYDLPMPLSVMSIEIHVQCRTGRAGISDSKEIAMKPNSEKDTIFAVVYVFGEDPGGGEALHIAERGCIFVPVGKHQHRGSEKVMISSMLQKTFGIASEINVEPVQSERHLLLRLASIVRLKDPDMLISWDTQGAGLGYIIERGAQLGRQGNNSVESSTSIATKSSEVDMVRLLGRTPRAKLTLVTDGMPNAGSATKDESGWDHQWAGSGLGSEWDDRVGPGAAAASIVGRLVFCGWKIAAEEVKHPNASYLPAMVSTVLNRRIPYHDDLVLSSWYGGNNGRERWRVLQHRLSQGVACLLLFDALDVIGRAGEAARLSGVEFSQSFPGIRGSQYKVEGVLLRALQSIQSDERGSKTGEQKNCLSDGSKGNGINPGSSLSSESASQTQSPWKLRRKLAAEIGVKREKRTDGLEDRCYFFFSPSGEASGRQEALECQALTLEPESGCYHDPVVVCDFTALYPSLVIAYNLCYSTCAGRLEYHSTRKEMHQLGQTTKRLGPFAYPESRTATVLAHHMKSLTEFTASKATSSKGLHKDRVYAVPTGTIFVAESVLKGVLPQVLDELLSTRAMLKKALKEYKRLVPNLAPSIQRQLEARQLALKYVANVTYGYTSATFSGRCAMPLVADAIVECGRKTLRNAIDLANRWGGENNGKWCGAKVIYGDTDSLFIKLPGRSIEEAFEFGEVFCKAVTASNPPPVQLKLEKVYGASMMQTKKKYCGMKYDSRDQRKPTFEAKGIETVRRDQCALTQKVLRNALITLFRSGLDAVKAYLYRQWSLIRAGRLPVSDFILTGRVRSKYRGGRIGPVQAALARRLAEADPGRTIRHKERLAYVIVSTPGTNWRLRDCVLTPMELLEQWDACSLHAGYYITKHVNAALQRCLGLAPFNVHVKAWYEACPKVRTRIHFWPITKTGSNQMISSYFGSDMCSLCGSKCKASGKAKAVVCADCLTYTTQAAHTAMLRLNKAQNDAQKISGICSKCNGCFEGPETFAAIRHGGDIGGTRRADDGLLTMQSRNKVPGVVTPLANCSCMDCPHTFERHRLRESELEAIELCKAMELL